MPDITMCEGGSCPKKDTCYRYIVIPSYRQTYFLTPPLNKDGTCTEYWKVKPNQMAAENQGHQPGEDGK